MTKSKMGTAAGVLGIVFGVLAGVLLTLGIVAGGLHESRSSSGALLACASSLSVLAVVLGIVAIAKKRTALGIVSIALVIFWMLRIFGFL